MKAEVDLVDIGGGNIGSISRCLERLAITYHNVNAQVPPTGNRPLVLPGVGNFGAVMEGLQSCHLDKLLPALVRQGTPYLGICVGMQILLDGSEESEDAKGLGLVPGKVVRFKHDKIPQIGWNSVTARHPDWEPGYAYFVNSYYPVPQAPEAILYEAEYGGTFCAAIRTANITAFQFHPEKSGQFGETLLQRWLSDVS